MNNVDLSIFVDELGDFGKYDIKSPYYIVALVFHDQSISINDEINKFDNYLNGIGLHDIIIHTGPIIRQENIYRNIDKVTRKRLINRFVSFVKKLDIIYSTFNIMLSNVKSKRVFPKDYRLFQVADLFCTIRHLELKIKNKNLSNSEYIILGNEKDIKQNLINKLKYKKFKE